MDQEQIMQFQMLEQEAQQLNQQLQMIEQNLNEINEIKESLGHIEKTETKEIMANLGKKIFIPVEIKEKKLIVEVGNKKFVKKTISETKELIEEQLGKLENAQMQISLRLNELQIEAQGIMEHIQSERSEKKGKSKKDDCEDGHDCKCGHKH